MFIEVRRLKSESKKQYGQPENVSTRRIMTLKKWENKRGSLIKQEQNVKKGKDK